MSHNNKGSSSPRTIPRPRPAQSFMNHFRQLESVSIRSSLALECHSAPAKYGNFLSAPVFLDHDRGARKPCTGLCPFRVQLDAVTAVILSAHSQIPIGSPSGRADSGSAPIDQMLTLPPLSLIPSFARASTTGISAPSVLPTSAASGRSLS